MKPTKDLEVDTEPLTSHQEVIIGPLDPADTREQKSRQIENARMRQASGNIDSSDPLVAFFYLLARDEMPLGDIEALIDQVDKDNTNIFTNGWMAQWAQDAARRLHGNGKNQV